MAAHFGLPPGDALDALASHSLPALVGIGVTFKRDKTRGCYVVRRVIERGPADREGGIVPGDVISEVDGILVASKSPEELTKLVLGPSGSSIDLGITRNGFSCPSCLITSIALDAPRWVLAPRLRFHSLRAPASDPRSWGVSRRKHVDDDPPG